MLFLAGIELVKLCMTTAWSAWRYWMLSADVNCRDFWGTQDVPTGAVDFGFSTRRFWQSQNHSKWHCAIFRLSVPTKIHPKFQNQDFQCFKPFLWGSKLFGHGEQQGSFPEAHEGGGWEHRHRDHQLQRSATSGRAADEVAGAVTYSLKFEFGRWKWLEYVVFFFVPRFLGPEIGWHWQVLFLFVLVFMREKHRLFVKGALLTNW